MAIELSQEQMLGLGRSRAPMTFAEMLRSKEVRRPHGWVPALGASLVFSFGLFWGMHALISKSGHGANKLETLPTIDFVRLKRDSNVTPNERKRPPPPPPPKSPPPPSKMTVATESTGTGPAIAMPGNLDLSAGSGGGGPGGGGVGFDSELVPLQRVNPAYPQDARRNKIEGYVKLELLVAADGSVRSAKVIESKPKNLFDSAAVTAVYKWRFKPKTVDGKAVEQKGQQRIDFALNK
jgi:protein TonB